MDKPARLRPSRADRWVKCPGSVAMEEQLPDYRTNTTAADEGTAAHSLAAHCLQSYAAGGPYRFASEYVGKSAANGVIITEDMAECVELYTQDVLNTLQHIGGLRQFRVEHRVYCTPVHPENSGTLDASCCVEDYSNEAGRLIIWDYKHGWALVEPVENYQLIDYAVGMLYELHERGRPIPQEIEFRIVQPRPAHPLGPIRSWVISTSKLNEYVHVLRTAAEEALGPEPRLITGPAQCRYCPGRYGCPALQATAMEALEIVQTASTNALNAEQLGSQLTLLKDAETLFKSYISGLEEQAQGEMRAGNTVPGWKLVNAHGRTTWRDTAETVALLDLLGKGDIAERGVKLATPAQLIKRGLDEELVNAYSFTPDTGHKLVRDKSQLARQVFTND